MDEQNRIFLALRPAVVDDLLRTPLNLGVATLHRVEVERSGVGATGHGAGRAAAHANLHARAAELNQQRTGGEVDLLGLRRVDHTQAARDHDGLVVTAQHAGHSLLVLAEVAQQVGSAELVVVGRAAQWGLGHDLQRAGDVIGLATRLVAHASPEFGDGETGQARLGPGAATGRALVANFTAHAGGGTREGRDGGRVVVGFHFHQDVVRGRLGGVAG